MLKKSNFNSLTGLVMACLIGPYVVGFSLDAHATGKPARHHLVSSRQATKVKPDLSGRKRIGHASVYAGKFAGKMMADGTKMNPHSNNAASKTLPLGTTAKVTNLQTGQSAKVTIRDRGPHVKGRILDVSPSTAHKIGITKHQGVVKVQVAPKAVAKTNDSMKPRIPAHKAKTNKTTSIAQRK
ncbi:septal ring lytic transglycosylase RlpA family protein [Polaromonas glacialis]|uniref:septal ring lytic transglycosylase RlpA family protein n=1 Tax=Polaromonas glacialis TaxID=866564 RepID=UPI000496364F|nr:septal ring lytic transglycosylase RlpA family protein [Polaromonas glacialis]